MLSLLHNARTHHRITLEWGAASSLSFRALVSSAAGHTKATALLQRALQALPARAAEELAADLLRDCYYYYSRGEAALFAARRAMEDLRARKARARGGESPDLAAAAADCAARWVEAGGYWRSVESVAALPAACAQLRAQAGREGRLAVVDLCFAVAR
jgi:hypothetical protein